MVISGLLIAGLPVPVKPIPPRLPPAWITLAVTVLAGLVHDAVPRG
jgi:hypothetical protein